jgi:hypothetical protein
MEGSAMLRATELILCICFTVVCFCLRHAGRGEDSRSDDALSGGATISSLCSNAERGKGRHVSYYSKRFFYTRTSTHNYQHTIMVSRKDMVV